MSSFLISLFSVLIGALPLMGAAAPLFFADPASPGVRLALLGLAPIVYVVLFVSVAGLLSRPFQKAIVRGKFPRQLNHPVYGPRRIYGLCWTALYYFSPLYWIVLTTPALKKQTLRLFGLTGALDFIVYPDTWLRDLPLLKIAKGAYLSNKSTVGTNMCLTDGSILVDHVEFGEGAMLGHMAMIAPGAKLGDKAETGVNSGIGIRASIGAHTKVGVYDVINHGARVGNGVTLGPGVYVGLKSQVGDGLTLPPYFVVPDGEVLDSQDKVSASAQRERTTLRAELTQALKNENVHPITPN